MPGHPQGNEQAGRTNITLIELLKAFTMKAQPKDWDSGPERTLFIYRATVYASTGVPLFKMLTGCELRVPSNIFPPSKEVAINNAPEYVLRLNEGIRRTLNFVQRHLQMSRPKQ